MANFAITGAVFSYFLIMLNIPRTFTLSIFSLALLAIVYLVLFCGGVKGIAITPWSMTDVDWLILTEVRLPKILTAITVGIALSLAGHLFQLLLSNPLAEPGLLGVSGISSLAVVAGAAICTVLGVHYQIGLMFLAATLGALCAIGVIFAIARLIGNYANSAIILAGICVTTISSAVASWLIYYSDNQMLRIFSLWLLGSFEHVNTLTAAIALGFSGLLSWLIFREHNALNFVLLGEKNAELSGINVTALRKRMLLFAALFSALAVALGGLVAFVGLLVPHATRLLFGNNNKLVVPFVAVMGALVMLLIEWLSRTTASTQLPLSLVSATFGGPLFILVLIKHFRFRVV